MVCRRCRGLLVCENFDDLGIETDSLYKCHTLPQLWVYRGCRLSCESLQQFGENARCPTQAQNPRAQALIR